VIGSYYNRISYCWNRDVNCRLDRVNIVPTSNRSALPVGDTAPAETNDTAHFEKGASVRVQEQM